MKLAHYRSWQCVEEGKPAPVRGAIQRCRQISPEVRFGIRILPCGSRLAYRNLLLSPRHALTGLDCRGPLLGAPPDVDVLGFHFGVRYGDFWGHRGAAFFSPFNSDRYFLPWRHIRVSPIGIGLFFTGRGLEVV